jgi:hypothetical protein
VSRELNLYILLRRNRPYEVQYFINGLKKSNKMLFIKPYTKMDDFQMTLNNEMKRFAGDHKQ